jgi:type III secretory pathway component EscS
VIFLLLSMVGFLYAAGPGHSLLPLAALDDLDAGTLYWAAACNLVCAVLLLGGTWVRTPLLRFGRAPLALAGES